MFVNGFIGNGKSGFYMTQIFRVTIDGFQFKDMHFEEAGAFKFYNVSNIVINSCSFVGNYADIVSIHTILFIYYHFLFSFI